MADSNLRVSAIAAIIIGLAAAFAYARGLLTPHKLTAARIADRFEQVNGLHPGFRRNHAKGVCVSGWFESNGNAVSVCKASVFQPGKVPVLGRFSFSGGQPYAADSARTVRGLGLVFKLAGGEEWRTAMINLPVFPVNTPQAFYDQLLAAAPDPATGKPDPAKLEAFLARYPASARAFQLIRAQPMSDAFEITTFNSLNVFRFVNASGDVSWVRWSFVPANGFVELTRPGAQPARTNELFDWLIGSVHQGPLKWHLMITVAQPGDPTDDATLSWPADRRKIDAGTLIIDHVESEDTSPARDINFDPLVLPDGMAASDDPLLSARSAVYMRSFTRREGERKTPSAVSAAEVAR